MRKNIFLLLFVAYSVAAASQRSSAHVHRRALLADPPTPPGNGANTGNPVNQATSGSANSDSPASPSPSNQSSSTTTTAQSTTTTSASTSSTSSDTSSSQSSSTTGSTTSSPTAKTDSTSSPTSTQPTAATTPDSSPSQDTNASTPAPTQSPGGPTSASSSDSPSSSGRTSSATGGSNNSDDSSVPTGTIIGLSVAGGVAVLAFVAFLIWKLTRKRFHGLEDIDEAIKWPEVGREASSNVGYATGPSTDALPHELSSNYSAPSRDYLPENNDPYAVPPLPNYNPNLPYRDDPNNGYYDPYRGPSPAALYEGPADGHENIPLDTLPNNVRTRSPAPNVALDATGRGSPAPGAIGYPAQPMGQSTYGQGGGAPYRGY